MLEKSELPEKAVWMWAYPESIEGLCRGFHIRKDDSQLQHIYHFQRNLLL